MFPIPKANTSQFKKSEIHTYRTFKSEIEKSKYLNLLNVELSAINSMSIDAKAQYIYNLKYDNPSHSVSKRCIDFKAMEQLALQYKN